MSKCRCVFMSCVAASFLGSSVGVWAQGAEEEAWGDGALARSMFGDDFEQSSGVRIKGVAQIGWSHNDASDAGWSPNDGHTNYPVVGANDEGFQLNGIQLTAEKSLKSNILPRITPLPGPKPEEFSWGFTAELIYGRNGLMAGMYGFDQQWAINRPGNEDAAKAATSHQNYLAAPQAFLQFYMPVLDGVAVTVGRFGSGVGYEIPPATRPSPNFFYTHTYALVSQPDQVAGVLVSTNVFRNNYGLLAAELGVVNGRQNWQDNNAQKSALGALRWRSPDMRTWVDYSFMSGDEQNDLDHDIQMPVSRILSDTGLRRDHHSLLVRHHFDERWMLAVEGLSGKQRGNADHSIDLITGQPFSGAHYRGANATLRYKSSKLVEYGVRVERFEDPDGFALLPTTTVAGSYNAVTVGANLNLHPHLVVRPEIRYDWQSDNDGVRAYGAGRAEHQTTFSIDALIYF